MTFGQRVKNMWKNFYKFDTEDNEKWSDVYENNLW